MKNMLNKYMQIAINEAKIALKKDNIPVGCVIIKNNEIISTAHNETFWHAELVCIYKAQKKLGDILSDCVLFCTLEPCNMCLGAIKLAKISKIVYGANNKNKDTKFKPEVINEIREKECSILVTDFFKNKRTK